MSTLGEVLNERSDLLREIVELKTKVAAQNAEIIRLANLFAEERKICDLLRREIAANKRANGQ